MNRQKKINIMLKNIESHRPVYNTFGKWIFKITVGHIFVFVDFFIPSFKIISYIGLKYFNKDKYEVLRI